MRRPDGGARSRLYLFDNYCMHYGDRDPTKRLFVSILSGDVRGAELAAFRSQTAASKQHSAPVQLYE